jgi:hypothetical protein
MYGTDMQMPNCPSRKFVVSWFIASTLCWVLVAVGVFLILMTLVFPFAIWPDWFGGPLAIASLLLLLAVNLSVVIAGKRAYLSNGIPQTVDIIRKLRESLQALDVVLIMIFVGGVALLIWVFASGHGNLIETIHAGRFREQQSGYEWVRYVSEARWDRLSAISNVWTQAAVAFALLSAALLSLRVNMPTRVPQRLGAEPLPGRAR